MECFLPNPEQLAADLQEASSIRFCVDLHIALLSSGNWAIFRHDGGTLGLQEIEIWPELHLGRLTGLAQAELTRLEWKRREVEEKRAAMQAVASGIGQITAKSVEDLGL